MKKIHSKDKHSKSFAKTITWRVIATGTTMFLVYIFTGNLTLVAGVGALDLILKMLFYYIHERVWTNISWGKTHKTSF